MASNIHCGRVPAVIKGHRHFSYGGATLPDSVTVEQYYDLTPSKKSNVRVNDEIIPKPTAINVGEKQIKVSIQREHPYQSHIPYCAMFPSYRCPDDPDTGVRATSKLPINPLIPASAPQVTILSKSKGAPYRHEVLDIPMETRQNATTWPGHNGFQNHVKPLKGEVQVFYPTAPKTLCPNLTLRDWKSTLLERTANALRNLEKSHWLTSYQLHFTGTGPTNPIKMDDFNEKTVKLITGEMNPYTAQLMERSYPIFLPTRPPEGRRDRILQSQSHLENPWPPYSPSFPPEPPDSGMSFTQTHGPLNSSLSAQLKCTASPNEEEMDTRVHFEQRAKNFEDEKKMKEISCIISPICQRLARGTFEYGVKKSSKDLGSDLLELQDSFSRSKAHRIFSESLQDATVDLRDNHHTGRKHFFYGFNSYYFHN